MARVRMDTGRNIFYSYDQECLLKAVILDGMDALVSWNKWNTVSDVHHADFGSQRLFPLIYQFVKKQGVDFHQIDKLKGVYRKAAIQNKLLDHEALEVVKQLNRSGINTMILKGSALVLGKYYVDPALRPMEDVDLAVPFEKKEEADLIIKNMGWVPEGSVSQYRALHSVNYKKGFQGIDLHWFILRPCQKKGIDTNFWNLSEEVSFYGERVYILRSEHQLLHACVHGLRYSSVIPPIRWIVDAAMILKRKGGSFDWDILMQEAELRKMSLPMAEVLNVLKNDFSLDIPECVINHMYSKSRFSQKLWFRAVTRKPLPVIGKHIIHYIEYRMFFREWYSYLGYSEFLKDLWSLKSLRQLPSVAFTKTLKNIKDSVSVFSDK